MLNTGSNFYILNFNFTTGDGNDGTMFPEQLYGFYADIYSEKSRDSLYYY